MVLNFFFLKKAQSTCYDLNVCVFPNSHVEIFLLNVIVLSWGGGGALGGS